ncbi:MAG: hypothetical protein LBK00_09495 [Treponema sp.]|jgi:hypothetical protein|nr:hypothetical protein [Treponema sp.]
MEKILFGLKGALFVVLLVLGHCGYSQTLWQNAQYGMTVEQIKGVYPHTVSVMEGNFAEDGSKELLKIGEVMISYEPFSVSFFFKSNKLTCVKLSPNDEYTKAQCERVYGILKRSLTVKYGNSISAGAASGWNLRKEHNTWLSDGVEIFLSQEFIDNRTILELFYRRGVVDTIDMDNL